MARLRNAGWFRGLLARIDDGSIATGDRPLLMIPGRQPPESVEADFDPTGFTAHELRPEAAQDPTALAELYLLVERHERQLRDSLATALAELPEPAQSAGDVGLTSPELRARIQDLAARYGLAAALAGKVTDVSDRLTRGQETLERREASAARLREVGIPPFPGDYSGLIKGFDLELRNLSVGVLTPKDREGRDERVRRDLAPALPELLTAAPGFEPDDLIDNAWRERGFEIHDRARRFMHQNNGRAPTVGELRDASHTGFPQMDLRLVRAPSPVRFPGTQPVAQRTRSDAQPSALRKAAVRGVRRLGRG